MLFVYNQINYMEIYDKAHENSIVFIEYYFSFFVEKSTL